MTKPRPVYGEFPPPTRGRDGWPWVGKKPDSGKTMPDGSLWPGVSIVTPSYNQGRFLEETIRSVLLQGYPNLEYIVIDGGSTDGSIEIIRKYEPWLAYWVSEPDSGQSDAINKGFRAAHGSYVAWLNSDDLYLPGALQQSVAWMARHPEIDMIYGDVVAIDQQSRSLGELIGEPFELRRLITEQPSVPQPTVIMKRSAVEGIGLLRTELHCALDLDLWIRLAVGGSRIRYLPGTRAAFRYHQNSKTMTQPVAFAAERLDILDRLFASLDKSDEMHSWRAVARSNSEIDYGAKLMNANRHREARQHLWEGLRRALWRPRSLLVVLLLLDAYTGLRTWHLATSLKRKLQGEELPEWQRL